MKFRLSRHQNVSENTSGLLNAAEDFFWAVGILTLGIWGFSVVYADLYQAYGSWSFDQIVQARPNSPGFHIIAGKDRGEAEGLVVAGARNGFPFGRIEVPRLGVAAMIAEGDDYSTLRKAVGHVPGTAFPGEPGNVGLAAHRDTFFRPLEHIRVHDDILLTTLGGVYRYRVRSLEVVEPKDVQVLDSHGGQSLTLVTCYPFRFVGSAPRRFIVQARRVAE